MFYVSLETTDDTRQTRDLVTRYLQSVSRDVRYLGSDKRLKKPNKTCRTVVFSGEELKIVACSWCRDKISTFVKSKDYHSDSRSTVSESDDSYYELWTDYKDFSPIKDFAYLSEGDIIRINKKRIVRLLCEPYIVGYRYRVTVATAKKEDL